MAKEPYSLDKFGYSVKKYGLYPNRLFLRPKGLMNQVFRERGDPS